MKMHYAATILFTVLHVHLRVSALDHTDVLAALQQACPYTNFCNKNASSYIQDGRQAPCCRECSCNDDCWKRGNCCPDKIVRDKGLAYEHETCKDTQVSSAGAATANGLSQFRRYFVTETCPETVEDDFVKEKCTGIVTETLTDLLWVSDPDTNRIYRNKFCAECHGIRKYQEWQISTNCLNLLLMENYTQNIRAYPDCRLSVIPPNTKAYDNQCLVPDISTCNETGLWQTKDSTTESLCNSHSLMFVKQFLLRSIVYRNVFCFKCNSPAGTTVEDICDSSEVGGKRTFDSFTAILNIFEADDTLLEERRCGMDEVEDPLKVTKEQIRWIHVFLKELKFYISTFMM